MTDLVELREVERIIQVVEDNLRQLQEEATAVWARQMKSASPIASLTRRQNSPLCSGGARF